MRIVTLFLSFFLYANSLWAGETSFVAALITEYKAGIGRIAIFPLGDNNFVVEIDPSHCDEVTKICGTEKTQRIKARGKAAESGFYLYDPQVGQENTKLRSDLMLSLKPISRNEVTIFWATSKEATVLRATPQFFVGEVPSVQ